MLTVGDLFSGIGGFSLGLERAGMRTAWFAEIDPYASAVLRKHWPGVPNHGDVRTITSSGVRALPVLREGVMLVPKPVERVDVLCGGFPCQPFSVAGKRLGREDDRALWPEYRRVIEELRPTWVIGENVVGFVNLELDNVLADLEGLGYAWRPFDIPACVLGAHHERRRIWIVAHSDNGQRERAREKVQAGRDASDGRVPAMADTMRGGREHGRAESAHVYDRPRDTPIGRAWRAEPDVGRVAHGVPSRVDRLRCLGNAIVPQIAEVIGKAIVSAHADL